MSDTFSIPSRSPRAGCGFRCPRSPSSSPSLFQELSQRVPRSVRSLGAGNPRIPTASSDLPGAAPGGSEGPPGRSPRLRCVSGSSAPLKVPLLPPCPPPPALALPRVPVLVPLQLPPFRLRQTDGNPKRLGALRARSEQEGRRMHKGWTGATAPLPAGQRARLCPGPPGADGRTILWHRELEQNSKSPRVEEVERSGRGDGRFPQVLGQCPLICIHLHAVNQRLTEPLRRSGLSPNLSGTFSLPVKVGLGCN